MRALGFNEVINYSLTKKETVNLYAKPNTDIIELLHPMSEDKKVLRHSLLNGLVDNVIYHQSRQMDDLKFFEVGRTYYSHEEPMHLSVIMTGVYEGMTWQKDQINASYYVVKGILESITDYFDLTPTFEASQIEGLHPGVTAKVSLGQDQLGIVGKLHPQTGIDAFVFEINLEVLLKHIQNQTNFETISRFPNITRDLAFVVDKSIPQANIEALIKQTARKFLVDLTLFDVYLDQKIGEDKKSLAYSMTFNAKDKTLEAADIDKLMRSILNRLQFEFKAEIRA